MQYEILLLLSKSKKLILIASILIHDAAKRKEYINSHFLLLHKNFLMLYYILQINVTKMKVRAFLWSNNTFELLKEDDDPVLKLR